MKTTTGGPLRSSEANDSFSGRMSPLHAALADGIARVVHEESMEPGARLSEKKLALELGVSRFPVRAALGHLRRLGFVERHHDGHRLAARPPLPPTPPEPASGLETLLARIARDHLLSPVHRPISQESLTSDYGVAPIDARHAFRRLIRLGLLERNAKDRWEFIDTPYDATAKRDCYRFRLLLEPAALFEADFALPRHWDEDMVARHEAFLYSPWLESYFPQVAERIWSEFRRRMRRRRLGFARCFGVEEPFGFALPGLHELLRLAMVCDGKPQDGGLLG